MLGGQFGQGGQLCLPWDAGEPAGLEEQLKSRGSDLRVLPRARCKPPWMLCLGFTLKGSINLIVTSSSGGREASVLLGGWWGYPTATLPSGPGDSKFSKPDARTRQAQGGSLAHSPPPESQLLLSL